MTNFSTNQVMQFYVASKAPAVSTIPGRGVSLIIDGKRTDIIENVLWGKLTTADALATPCKLVTVSVNNLVKGENCIVRVSYPEVFGAGKESWTTKTAMAQIKSEDISDIVLTIKEQLEESLPEFIKVIPDDTALGFIANPDVAGYKRGFRPVVMPDFEVSVNTIVKEGEDVQWATITVGKSDDDTVSGKFKLADMEYFALGERGDEYRQMGWPAVTYDADYKIDPKAAQEYDVLVVHYAFAGSNDQSHLSEKDLIIAAPSGVLDTFAANLAFISGAPFTKVAATETPITPVNPKA